MSSSVRIIYYVLFTRNVSDEKERSPFLSDPKKEKVQIKIIPANFTSVKHIKTMEKLLPNEYNFFDNKIPNTRSSSFKKVVLPRDC